MDDNSLENTLKRQLYVGIITSMETYLSDAFINTTLDSKKFTRKFVGTFDEFGKSIKLRQLFEHRDKIEIETICRQLMLDVIYHNLKKVKEMYKETLEIELGDIGALWKAVLIRHDLVHRSGKTKDENERIIDTSKINDLILEVETFVNRVDKQIEEKKL